MVQNNTCTCLWIALHSVTPNYRPGTIFLLLLVNGLKVLSPKRLNAARRLHHFDFYLLIFLHAQHIIKQSNHKSSGSMPTLQASQDGNRIVPLDSYGKPLNQVRTCLLLSSLLSQPPPQLLHKS